MKAASSSASREPLLRFSRSAASCAADSEFAAGASSGYDGPAPAAGASAALALGTPVAVAAVCAAYSGSGLQPDARWRDTRQAAGIASWTWRTTTLRVARSQRLVVGRPPVLHSSAVASALGASPRPDDGATAPLAAPKPLSPSSRGPGATRPNAALATSTTARAPPLAAVCRHPPVAA